jgi:hypothetical protein
MDSKSIRVKRIGVTPAKLALIAVLAVVLVAVLYLQFGTPSAGTAEGMKPTPRRTPVAAQPAAATPAPGAKNAESPPESPKYLNLEVSAGWQATDLRQAIKYDPFALPSSFPKRLEAGAADKQAQETSKAEDSRAAENARAEALKNMQSDFSQLQRKGVHVVMQEHDKYVALIGDKTIHVGDEIDGFTVVAIDAQGVRVARDLKQ